MPRGPRGERRPADVIGNTVMVANALLGGALASGFAPPSYTTSRDMTEHQSGEIS